MRELKWIYAIAALCLVPNNSFGQEDIDLFGYFQVNFTHINETLDFSNSTFNFSNKIENKRNSFMVQQANIFLRKEINEELTAWLNFEFENSFSSERNWGSFNLEEAWVKYHHNQKFNIKAGLLIPEFNNLLQVKNRTPYLPYIMRPLVYETSISEILPIGDFVPERAYLQAYGTIPTSNFLIDYAAFIGNSEADFISSESMNTIRAGEDTTVFVTVGGRFGVRKEQVKLGVSFSNDKDNQNERGLRDVNRWRIGSDFSFSFGPFWGEAELILVKHDFKQSNIDLDKVFYYSTLGYDFSEKFFSYVTYNFLKDEFLLASASGGKGFFIGAGCRPDEALVFKAQFTKIITNNVQVPPDEVVPIPLSLDYDFNIFSIALSVFF